MTPNHLTTLRLAAGVAAAAAFAVGDAFWRDVGAGVFVLSMVLDRADGELARLGGKTSKWGHTYDLVADALCNALLFVGLGIGLAGGAHGVWAIPMGALAGGSVAAILGLTVLIEAREGQRAAEVKGFAGLDPDDAIVLVPVAVWLGWAEPLLVAAAIGAPTFVVFFLWLLRRRLAAAKPEKGAQGPRQVDHGADAGGDEERHQ